MLTVFITNIVITMAYVKRQRIFDDIKDQLNLLYVFCKTGQPAI